MKYRVFNIPCQFSEAATAELNQFISSSQVLGIDKQLVQTGADSFWSFVVSYAEATAVSSTNNKRGQIDYRDVLSPHHFAIFAKLRELRKNLAQQTGVPPYAIFTNEQLAAIAQLNTATKAALQTIEGIGEKRVAQYGDAFLALLEQTHGEANQASAG